jgi:mRNA interferase MazF
MKIHQRDIVWVSFPYTDGSHYKERPALVLSNNAYNTNSDDVLLAYITSTKRDTFEVAIKNSDLLDGYLKISSYVRYDKILLIDKAKLHGIIAVASRPFYDKVILRIIEFIK